MIAVRTRAERTSWSAGSQWEAGGLRREVFWVRSGAEQLSASLYSVRVGAPSMGVLVLPAWGGWGRDGRLLLEWCHRLAAGVAGLGGCGLLVQWPGHEDSEGDASALTFDRLVDVALDSLSAGRKRFPATTWALAGIRMGGTVAALAGADAAVPTVLLIQPDLDPARYFDEVERTARRNRFLGESFNPHTGWSIDDVEIPEGLRRSDAAPRIRAALESLECTTGIVRYTLPAPDPLPDKLVDMRGDGNWWWPPGGDHRLLRRRALDFLRSRRALVKA